MICARDRIELELALEAGQSLTQVGECAEIVLAGHQDQPRRGEIGEVRGVEGAHGEREQDESANACVLEREPRRDARAEGEAARPELGPGEALAEEVERGREISSLVARSG